MPKAIVSQTSHHWWHLFWSCWLDIEMRLLPELYAWRYSTSRFSRELNHPDVHRNSIGRFIQMYERKKRSDAN